MDNAYSAGFDYDAYRDQGPRTEAYPYALYVYPEQKPTIHRRKVRALVVATILAAVLALVWYAMRFIPLFDIDRIEFMVSGGFDAVPQEAARLADSHMGSSLMSRSPSTLQDALQALPVVERATVRRKLFSTVQVGLVIRTPEVFIASVDPEDRVLAINLFADGKLMEVDAQDFRMYGNRAFVIEVSPAYAEHLRVYGIDEGMQDVIELASKMGMDEDGRYRIVGRIRYDESLGEGFGNMVMDLPAYHSRLYIREPVSESRLHDAIRLIKLEQDSFTSRNIALIGQLRYDLYAQSLVVRR